MVAQAIATARAAGVTGQILVRGDSAYGTAAVVAACVLRDEVGEVLSRQCAVCETTDERVSHRGLRQIGVVAPQRL
jgi:hypothetical protein